MPERQVADGAGDAPSHREIEQASWLSPSALLLVGPFGQEGRELTASLVVRGESTRLECRSLPLGTTSTDGSDADGVLVVDERNDRSGTELPRAMEAVKESLVIGSDRVGQVGKLPPIGKSA